MAYAFIFTGIWVEVDFKINKDIFETKHPIGSNIEICGIIQASQLMGAGKYNPAKRLYFKGSDKPDNVVIGSPIELDRKAVVAPVTRGGALSIDYKFHCPSNKELIVQGSVPFYMKPSKSLSFVANQSLLHTKHDENGLFSVSIKFIPTLPVEGSHVAKIRGYEVVPANSEDALMKAVANQPVSVSLDAGGYDFQFYNSGVFTGKCGTFLDHGVTAIGYGATSSGIKYWLLKNSWGTKWSDKGFIKLQRGVRAKEGLCGIYCHGFLLPNCLIFK